MWRKRTLCRNIFNSLSVWSLTSADQWNFFNYYLVNVIGIAVYWVCGGFVGWFLPIWFYKLRVGLVTVLWHFCAAYRHISYLKNTEQDLTSVSLWCLLINWFDLGRLIFLNMFWVDEAVELKFTFSLCINSGIEIQFVWQQLSMDCLNFKKF